MDKFSIVWSRVCWGCFWVDFGWSFLTIRWGRRHILSNSKVILALSALMRSLTLFSVTQTNCCKFGNSRCFFIFQKARNFNLIKNYRLDILFETRIIKLSLLINLVVLFLDTGKICCRHSFKIWNHSNLF